MPSLGMGRLKKGNVMDKHKRKLIESTRKLRDLWIEAREEATSESERKELDGFIKDANQAIKRLEKSN